MAAMNATTAEPSAICAGVGVEGGRAERKGGPIGGLAWPGLARLITIHSSFIHNENRSNNNNLNEQSNNRADLLVFFLFFPFVVVAFVVVVFGTACRQFGWSLRLLFKLNC